VVAETALVAARDEQFLVARRPRRGQSEPTSQTGEKLEERNSRELEPTGVVGSTP